MVSDEELMVQARKRAEEKVGFFIHLSVYAVINGLFILGWWFSGAGFPWFVFPMGFWGIGLVAHGMGVFVGTGMSDKMALREFEKLKHGKDY